MKKLQSIIIAILVLLSTGLHAQPQGGERPAPPKMKNPEEIAKMQTDMMKMELGLTDKQYKQVFKLTKNDIEYRNKQAEQQFGGGMPPQGGPGGPGGQGGPGGGMNNPGGMRGGSMGGPGDGMNNPGGMRGGNPGGMPPQGSGQHKGDPNMCPDGDFVSNEYLEKHEMKLKKILTPEQYKKWRSKHPDELHQLPPIDRNKMMK